MSFVEPPVHRRDGDFFLMKMFCLSDNIDTLHGMRLAGIEGRVVHEREEFLSALDACLEDKSVGIVFITTLLYSKSRQYLDELRLTLNYPLLTEIPDRHTTTKPTERIRNTIKHTIGIEID